MREFRDYVQTRRVYFIGLLVGFGFCGLWIAGVATPYSWIAFRGTFFALVFLWIGDKRLRSERWHYRFRWVHLIAVLCVLFIVFYVIGRMSGA